MKPGSESCSVLPSCIASSVLVPYFLSLSWVDVLRNRLSLVYGRSIWCCSSEWKPTSRTPDGANVSGSASKEITLLLLVFFIIIISFCF